MKPVVVHADNVNDVGAFSCVMQILNFAGWELLYQPSMSKF